MMEEVPDPILNESALGLGNNGIDYGVDKYSCKVRRKEKAMKEKVLFALMAMVLTVGHLRVCLCKHAGYRQL